MKVEQLFESHEHESLEIVYMAHDGACTKRTVKVISADEHGVLAYCYLRKQIRRFTKENILAAFPKTFHH